MPSLTERIETLKRDIAQCRVWGSPDVERLLERIVNISCSFAARWWGSAQIRPPAITAEVGGPP